MKKTLKNRLNTFEAVYRFCQENSGVWTFLLALANAIAALGLNIEAIISTEAKQQSNNKGVTLTKKQLKQAMLNIASGTAGAMQAYAKSINDMTLFAKLSFNEGSLFSGSGSNAVSACREVYTIVSGIAKADREVFGVSDAVLLSLKNATDDFEFKGNPSTRNVRTEKTALTEMLATLVNEGNSIMRNEILKLARQLKESNPEFYIALRQNAKVIESETHTKIRIDATDDVSGKALAGMTAKVKDTDLTAETNTKGKCLIYVPAGDYTLELTKDNYIGMTLDVAVKRGSNTVKVQMSPDFIVPPVSKEKKKAKA